MYDDKEGAEKILGELLGMNEYKKSHRIIKLVREVCPA